jgi:hypothetical protein
MPLKSGIIWVLIIFIYHTPFFIWASCSSLCRKLVSSQRGGLFIPALSLAGWILIWDNKPFGHQTEIRRMYSISSEMAFGVYVSDSDELRFSPLCGLYFVCCGWSVWIFRQETFLLLFGSEWALGFYFSRFVCFSALRTDFEVRGFSRNVFGFLVYFLSMHWFLCVIGSVFWCLLYCLFIFGYVYMCFIWYYGICVVLGLACLVLYDWIV